MGREKRVWEASECDGRCRVWQMLRVIKRKKKSKVMREKKEIEQTSAVCTDEISPLSHVALDCQVGHYIICNKRDASF